MSIGCRCGTLCLCLAVWAGWTQADEEQRPPNIILIVADDLGWSDLTCYGADLHETPHLDQLAAAGIRFTTAYASAPVCSPTRAALLTGKHPARLRMTIWREATANPPRDRKLLPPVVQGDLPHEEWTLAEALRQRGYATAHVGKWHLGDAAHFPETQGFDLHVAGNHWGAPATHFFPFRAADQGERRYVPGLGLGKQGEYLADRLTDVAIEMIGQLKEQPFFLNLWHYSVHTPIEAKPADVAHFQAKLAPENVHRNATYAAMVKNLDDNVGRLLQAVALAGLAERTLVVFTSDNGGYTVASRQQPGVPVTSNHPLRSGKGSLYEGGIRIPWIVRWPEQVPAGSVCDVPVASADFYRTICELAGVDAKVDAARQSDGTSLAALWRDPTKPMAGRELYWHFPHYYPTTTPAGAVREGSWKLIEYFENPHVELFDLTADPAETKEISAEQPEIAARLHEKLRKWRASVQAQMPEPNPEFTGN